ncbi:MAG: O-antigen ligase family protein [Candidatus Omnitrophota bacterium]
MTKEKIINFCDRVIEMCLYVLLAAVTFSTSIVEIAASTMIVFWSLRKLLKKDFKLVDSVPARILGVYLLWVILSCFNSDYADESFRGIMKWLEYSMIFIVIATTVWKEDAIRRFMYVTAGTVIIVSFNGFYQYFTGEGLIRHRQLTHLDDMRRVLSSFVHPNDYAAYLIVVTVIFIAFLIAANQRLRSRLAMTGLIAVSSVSLFLTRSRGAWLAFVAAFLSLGSLRSKKIVLVFIALILAVFVMLPQSTKDRLYSLTDLQEGTAWERVMLWKGTANMIKVHPVLGMGVNTFSRNFPKYKPPEYPDLRYTHNSYLQMASEIGIVGALIFLAFLAAVLFYSLRGIASMSGGQRKNLTVGVFAGIVGLILNCAVDTHLYSVNLAVFFHLLLGFCFSISCNAQKN